MTRLPTDEPILRLVAATAVGALSRSQLTTAIERCARRADDAARDNAERARWSAAADAFRAERRRRY